VLRISSFKSIYTFDFKDPPCGSGKLYRLSDSINLFPIKLSTASTNAPINATKNDSITNPDTKDEINQSMSALITKENNPSVSKCIGSVSIVIIGFIVIFITPKIRATITAM